MFSCLNANTHTLFFFFPLCLSFNYSLSLSVCLQFFFFSFLSDYSLSLSVSPLLLMSVTFSSSFPFHLFSLTLFLSLFLPLSFIHITDLCTVILTAHTLCLNSSTICLTQFTKRTLSLSLSLSAFYLNKNITLSQFERMLSFPHDKKKHSLSANTLHTHSPPLSSHLNISLLIPPFSLSHSLSHYRSVSLIHSLAIAVSLSLSLSLAITASNFLFHF
jgi:hypothetical protein